MTIYEADGQLWTEDGLYRETRKQVRAEWDESTQGPFQWNWNDYLTESIQTGTIKEIEVND